MGRLARPCTRTRAIPAQVVSNQPSTRTSKRMGRRKTIRRTTRRIKLVEERQYVGVRSTLVEMRQGAWAPEMAARLGADGDGPLCSHGSESCGTRRLGLACTHQVHAPPAFL